MKFQIDKRIVVAGSIGLFIILLVVFSNHYLMNEVNSISHRAPNFLERIINPKSVSKSSDDPSMRILHVIRKSREDQSTEHVFLQGKEIVASYKMVKGKRKELSGPLPEGEIKFVDEIERTYGFETLLKGKRHGAYKEYYQDDTLKTKALYQKGRLLERFSFFLDGSIRTEEDYRKAMYFFQIQDLMDLPQIGEGKMYRSNGALKWEWSLVDGGKRNYSKIYNRLGEVIEVTYYNQDGEIIE